MAAERVVLGSRRTPLALAQSELVARELARAGHQVQVLAMATAGDSSLGGSLATAKGLFTAELDGALLRGEVDLVVHSLKDLPLDDEPGVELLAVPRRERANDVLVVRAEGSPPAGACELAALADAPPAAVDAAAAFAALAHGTTIGTSSPRRQSGALALRPDLVCVAARGSVERRLERLRSGAVDALLLAEAGLVRLLRAHAATTDAAELRVYPHAEGLRAFRLDLATWPAAPGQGALAVQGRATGSWQGHPSLTALDDAAARRATALERELLGALGGGCALPLGVTAGGGMVHAALAAESWRRFAGVGAAPRLVRRSFQLANFDPKQAARELLADVSRAAAEEPPLARALLLEESGEPPRWIVTSTPAAAARLARVFARRGTALATDFAGDATAVAALEVTARRVLPEPWPVERVALGDDRRRWPWVLVSSPSAAAILVERTALEPLWLRLPWCALGEGTARALLELGVPAGLCAGGRSAVELASFALRHLEPQAPLFLPQSALATPELADRLRESGREVVAWPAYTVEPRRGLRWPATWESPRAVLFTAPSAAAAWAANDLPWPREAWTMGAATRRELERLGAPAIRLADLHDAVVTEATS